MKRLNHPNLIKPILVHKALCMPAVLAMSQTKNVPKLARWDSSSQSLPLELHQREKALDLLPVGCIVNLSRTWTHTTQRSISCRARLNLCRKESINTPVVSMHWDTMADTMIVHLWSQRHQNHSISNRHRERSGTTGQEDGFPLVVHTKSTWK